MPRCLMAKKWKGYPWPTTENPVSTHVGLQDDEEEEEIDVVTVNSGTSPMPTTVWGPSSPTEGATAPSPPPCPDSGRISVHCNGYVQDLSHYSAFLPREPCSPPPSYVTLQTANATSTAAVTIATPTSPPSAQSPSPVPAPPPVSARTKSLAMCFTSTGAALSLPPKKKDIYRPYSLDDRPSWRPAEEDLSAAHAILDLSASPPAPSVKNQPAGYVQDLSHYSAFLPREPCSPPPSYVTLQTANATSTAAVTIATPTSPPSAQSPSPVPAPPPVSARTKSLAMCFTSTGAALSLPPKKKDIYRPYSLDDRPSWRPAEEDLSAAHAILDLSASPPAPSVKNQPAGKTVAYTYEAFFVSDGRSKNKTVVPDPPDLKPRYTCSECGKQYATSSNLSRHKQTHRSLDSQSAKKCMTCGKAYVSMPALAMHLLTHKLTHACGVCGKMFSRPWLLQGHLRSHTGEKPYGCAHCGKAFADRSNLRAHMQTHSTDKNFACSRCHKTFALKSYLNKHLESACLVDSSPSDDIVKPAIMPLTDHNSQYYPPITS